MRFVLLSSLLIWSLPGLAWHVHLQPETQNIIISNHQTLHEVHHYLVWFDLDKTDELFTSWRANRGQWQSGLWPLSSSQTTLLPFEPQVVGPLPFSCPPAHRCFLASVALPPGLDPLADEYWQASAILPLSLAASCERLKGQKFFLPCTPQQASLEPILADTLRSESAVLENSAIIKQQGSQIVYANRSAQRFQIIDLSRPEYPKLVAEYPLSAPPQALFINEQDYLLVHNTEDETTFLTFEQDLTLKQRLNIAGTWRSGQRQGDWLYVVTQMTDRTTCATCAPQLMLYTLHWPSPAELTVVARVQLSGYAPEMTLVPNYLILSYQDPQQWPQIPIQTFTIAPTGQLLPLMPLSISASVSALEYRQNQLYVISSSAQQLLSIYDLSTMKLLEQIAFAAGETFLTSHVHDERLFIATADSATTVWIFDFNESSAALESWQLPAGIKQLFFHDQQLLTLGFEESSQRRLSINLFDYAQTGQPQRQQQLIPLAEQLQTSWSPALAHEQALLLDWENSTLALALESWETPFASHLHRLSLSQFADQQSWNSATAIQHNILVTPNTLVAISAQMLTTFEATDLSVLAQLPLAANMTWFQEHGGDLWAAAESQQGYYQLARYEHQTLETPVETWSLPRNYAALTPMDNWILFYDQEPLIVQRLDWQRNEWYPPQVLLETTSTSTLSQPLYRLGQLFFGERRAVDSIEQWWLHSWSLDTLAPGPSRSIPGQPVAFTPQGELITQELNPQDQLRLNRLALETEHARLLDQQSFLCHPDSEVINTQTTLYLNCRPQVTPNQAILFQLNPQNDFAIERYWLLLQEQQLKFMDAEVILTQHTSNKADNMTYPQGCYIYQLLPRQLKLLHYLPSCSKTAQGVLSTTQAWLANGFEGLNKIHWSAAQ